MPLDRENGEKIEGLDGLHVVVPTNALSEMTNLLTETPTKGGVLKQPVFEDAAARARQAFAKAGSLISPSRSFDDEDILVQVYPSDSRVVVIFQRKVAAEEMFFWRSYDLPRPVVEALLERAGKAQRVH